MGKIMNKLSVKKIVLGLSFVTFFSQVHAGDNPFRDDDGTIFKNRATAENLLGSTLWHAQEAIRNRKPAPQPVNVVYYPPNGPVEAMRGLQGNPYAMRNILNVAP